MTRLMGSGKIDFYNTIDPLNRLRVPGDAALTWVATAAVSLSQTPAA